VTSSFVCSWGIFRTLSVALMMFVHGTKAGAGDIIGTTRLPAEYFGEPRNDLEAWETVILLLPLLGVYLCREGASNFFPDRQKLIDRHRPEIGGLHR
jgi:hypothetical protein